MGVANGPYKGGHIGAKGGLMAHNGEGIEGFEGIEGIEKDKRLSQKDAERALEAFFEQYKDATGKEHPGIAQTERQRLLLELEEILERFSEVVEVEPSEALRVTIVQFFADWQSGNLDAEDPTVWLFVTPKVWRYRAYRAGVVDTKDVFDVDGSVLGE